MLLKKKILTVSNDNVLVALLQQGLGDNDYEIISTRNTGSQLREIIESEDPEFIIQDIIMPSLDGIGNCLQIRQWTHIPILMLSTWDTGDGTVRGLDLCSDCYLTEPFSLDILRLRIEETIKRNVSAAYPMSNNGLGI
ncbi:MAG: response regulator [Dehalococcoidales bacterium]|nr:response regulator [Dehalococcoidales bacterium]